MEAMCLTNKFNVDRARCNTDVRDNINISVRHTLRGDLA